MVMERGDRSILNNVVTKQRKGRKHQAQSPVPCFSD